MGKFPAFLILLLPLAASAQEMAAPVEPKPPQPAKENPPAIEKLDDRRFRMAGITFDKTTREIRLPVSVNMIEGALEYLLVHSKGKIHESLLVTDVSPTHLNVVFTLLRYKPSKEMYSLDTPAEHQAGTKFPEVPAEVKDAARVDLKVEWEESPGKTRSVPVNEWISHGVTEKRMPAGPWVYGGSAVLNGRYQAEATGDVVAIFLSNSAILNYPGQDNRDDEAWLPFPKRVPPVGTKATLIFTPTTPPKPATKP